MLAATSAFWAGAWTASLMVVLAALRLPATYYSFLSLWRLEGRSVPVWVGEIGTEPGDTSPLWQLVWGCLPSPSLAKSLALSPTLLLDSTLSSNIALASILVPPLNSTPHCNSILQLLFQVMQYLFFESYQSLSIPQICERAWLRLRILASQWTKVA